VAVDGLGNLYIADSGSNTAFEWNTAAGLTPLAAGLSDPTGVAVDGQANIYIADTGNSALKRWSTATQQLTVLISSGLNGPAGLAVDSSGNVYLADTGNHAIREVSFAFVGPASLTEAAPAGADALLPVLPASISLAGIFAPSSDQGWLTIGTIANGVVNFSLRLTRPLPHARRTLLYWASRFESRRTDCWRRRSPSGRFRIRHSAPRLSWSAPLRHRASP
jgi:DNA-binding beta-propeller fold protein YncE